MKKNILGAVFLISLGILLSGCSSQNQTETSNTSGSSGDETTVAARPDRDADIVGMVKSMEGNIATILLLDTSALPGGGQGMGMPEGMENTEAADTETQSATLNAGVITGATGGGPGGGGGMMMGGGPGGGGPMGEDGETDNSAMLEMMEEMSIGEEEVVIPVGIAMVKNSFDEDSKKSEEVAADFTDVAENSMVTIWLDESVTDRNVAEYVVIR